MPSLGGVVNRQYPTIGTVYANDLVIRERGIAPGGIGVHAPDLNTGVAIVRIGTRVGYLESRSFNLAYWRGETEFADHE